MGWKCTRASRNTPGLGSRALRILKQFVSEGDLKTAPTKETFVRLFAYANGPAYGLLLDDSKMDWREGIRPTTDLAAILLKSGGQSLPADISVAAKVRAKKYDGADLAALEDAREQAHQKVRQDYRARLVDGPVLQLPLRLIQMQFDPGTLVPLGRLGHPRSDKPGSAAQRRFCQSGSPATNKSQHRIGRRHGLDTETQTRLVGRSGPAQGRFHNYNFLQAREPRLAINPSCV